VSADWGERRREVSPTRRLAPEAGAWRRTLLACRRFVAMLTVIAAGTGGLLATTSAQASAPRCPYVVGYQVNLGSDLTDPVTRATVLKVVHESVAKVSAATGQSYRDDGLTTFIPTRSNQAFAPDDLVIAFINPRTTDFFGAPDFSGERLFGWTRWLGTPTAITAAATVIDSQSHWNLPSGLDHQGGPSMLALIEHELGHTVGLSHSADPTTTMFPVQSKLTPASYSSSDVGLLRASACRARIRS
jgi:hypothetical protein